MSSHSKIQPGMICVYDINNIKNNKVYYPAQVQIIKRVKKRPAGRSIWLVQDMTKVLKGDNSDGFYKSEERLLIPFDGMVVVRNPLYTPSFTYEDVNTIDRIISDVISLRVYLMAKLGKDFTSIWPEECFPESSIDNIFLVKNKIEYYANLTSEKREVNV